MPDNTVETFADHLGDLLGALPGVEAALGGSRAQGTHRPDSDWDVSVYYCGAFDPADLRALGFPGEVSEICPVALPNDLAAWPGRVVSPAGRAAAARGRADGSCLAEGLWPRAKRHDSAEVPAPGRSS